jgi:hypothetical protein
MLGACLGLSQRRTFGREVRPADCRPDADNLLQGVKHKALAAAAISGVGRDGNSGKVFPVSTSRQLSLILDLLLLDHIVMENSSWALVKRGGGGRWVQ